MSAVSADPGLPSVLHGCQRALLVNGQWADSFFRDGPHRKLWDLRSQASNYIGARIALVKAGENVFYQGARWAPAIGTVTFTGCERISRTEIVDHRSEHRMGEAEIQELTKRWSSRDFVVAWKFDNPIKLETPVWISMAGQSRMWVDLEKSTFTMTSTAKTSVVEAGMGQRLRAGVARHELS